MDNPVPVTLITGAVGVLLFPLYPAPGITAAHGIRRQQLVFKIFDFTPG